MPRRGGDRHLPSSIAASHNLHHQKGHSHNPHSRKPSYSTIAIMPRRIPSQVPDAMSRLLKGGSLVAPPISYAALTAHPPPVIPPRGPSTRTAEDLRPGVMRRLEKLRAAEQASEVRRNPYNSKKKAKAAQPKTRPQAIVYLHDRVRKQFYLDHPWEGLRPRQIVEKETIDPLEQPPKEVRELSWWGTNPSPEDAVALTVHLHNNHDVSLTRAYQYALSQYHALRAEHETTERYAVAEARAYGGSFTLQDAEMDAALKGQGYMGSSETTRGFQRENRALKTWEKQGEAEALAAMGQSTKVKKTRTRPAMSGQWFSGSAYMKSTQYNLQPWKRYDEEQKTLRSQRTAEEAALREEGSGGERLEAQEGAEGIEGLGQGGDSWQEVELPGLNLRGSRGGEHSKDGPRR